MYKKCPYLEFFWSIFSRIRIEYSAYLRIESECGKTRTRKTPNTDSFYVVLINPFHVNVCHFSSLVIPNAPFPLTLPAPCIFRKLYQNKN